MKSKSDICCDRKTVKIPDKRRFNFRTLRLKLTLRHSEWNENYIRSCDANKTAEKNWMHARDGLLTIPIIPIIIIRFEFVGGQSVPCMSLMSSCPY